MKIARVVLIRIWLPKNSMTFKIFGTREFSAITLVFDKLHPNIWHQIKEQMPLSQNKVHLMKLQ